MSHNIHFSIDDVILSFKSLTEHKDFESIPTVKLADWLWNQYEISTSLFCFMQGYGIQLQAVPDVYAEEFQRRKNYLKLGFHSIDAETDYSICSAYRAKQDYEAVIEQLLRITGNEESFISRKIRVHNYNACSAAVIGFRDAKCGISELLTADTNGLSYDLEENQVCIVNKFGIYRNAITGIDYRKTNIRAEKSGIQKVISDVRNTNDIEIFTHEWALIDENIETIKAVVTKVIEVQMQWTRL